MYITINLILTLIGYCIRSLVRTSVRPLDICSEV